MPQRQISEVVNISPASVQRRVSLMEEAGVIARNVAEVNRDALGLTITSIVEVNMVNEQSANVDATKALFRATPEVQQCYYVTGGKSFILVIVAQDMKRYEALTRRILADNIHVASYHSLLALDCVKTGNSVIVPELVE